MNKPRLRKDLELIYDRVGGERMNCEECLNSRLILSENGWHAICTLSQEDVHDCFVNGSKFLPLKKEGEANEN